MVASVDGNISNRRGQSERRHGWPPLRGDDRAYGLAVERAGQIASLQAIDDLDRAAMLGIPHELEHSMLKDDIGEVELLELLDGNLGDEFRVTVLFRISGVEALFVLDIDH